VREGRGDRLHAGHPVDMHSGLVEGSEIKTKISTSELHIKKKRISEREEKGGLRNEKSRLLEKQISGKWVMKLS